MINILLEGKRNTGKTTYLLEKTKEKISDDKLIIVMDSATDHQEKSLIRKLEKKYDNCLVIDVQDKNKLVLNKIGEKEFVKNYKNFFPYSEIINNKEKIICFDLSFFLEKGHSEYANTRDIKKYKYYRALYNELAEQIVLMIILINKEINEDIVLFTDEIEFSRNKYEILKSKNTFEIYSAIHKENAFGSFYEGFNKIVLNEVKK